MGDCRICIQISKRCLVGKDDDNRNVDLIPVSVKLWSADTTIYELFESISTSLIDCLTSSTLFALIQSGSVSVWDCTSYPPQKITDSCQSVALCRSKTLYSAGWFPSGNIQILPMNVDGPLAASPELYDDFQYNQKPQSAEVVNPLPKVRLLIGKGELLTPSQVLQGIAERFENDDMSDNNNDQDTRRIRQEYQIKKKEAEALRNRLLEDRIRKLSKGKNQPVSDQVRKMLIKSRATGRASVRPDDRVYFHCILWNDEEDVDAISNETYRYFSIQDTVGHSIDSLTRDSSLPHLSPRKEMVVKVTNSDESTEFRQLSYRLRFYEAIEQNFLSKEVNTVIIRAVTSADQDASSNFVSDVDVRSMPISSSNGALSRPETVMNKASPNDASSSPSSSGIVPAPSVSRPTFDCLRKALKLTLQRNGRISSKTKSSTAKEKVRQMQMKSKAKGDVKRVKNMEQRFFLHCVTVIVDRNESGDGSVQLVEDSPMFVSRSDSLHRLLRECTPNQSNENRTATWELLVVGRDPNDETTFLCISTSDDTKDETKSKMTWNDVEESGIVKCFDTVILCYFKD